MQLNYVHYRGSGTPLHISLQYSPKFKLLNRNKQWLLLRLLPNSNNIKQNLEIKTTMVQIDFDSFSPCEERSDDEKKNKSVSSSSSSAPSLVFAPFDLEISEWDGRFVPRRDDDSTTTNLSSASSEDSWINGILARFESRYVFDCCFIVLLLLVISSALFFSFFRTSTMVVEKNG
jgi:hypothetical protein